MGRAKRLGAGTRDGGLAIEYVRTRRVVRLLGWWHDTPINPVEIPVDQLCQQLGIDPRHLGAPRQYLLFAGSHRRPAGGLRDLVGTFQSEDRAWAAFRELRQAHPSTQGWAELASMDGLGQVSQMAWFGLHPATEPGDAAAPALAAPGNRRRSLRRLLASGQGPSGPLSGMGGPSGSLPLGGMGGPVGSLSGRGGPGGSLSGTGGATGPLSGTEGQAYLRAVTPS